MSHIEILGWWSSILGGMGLLALLTAALAWGLQVLAGLALKHLLFFTRIVTANYWIRRMEAEGLTACQADYRRMVAERNPKSIADLKRADDQWQATRRAKGEDA